MEGRSSRNHWRLWPPREASCIPNAAARLEALGGSTNHHGGVTKYVITLSGVPIGMVNLPRGGDRFTVSVTPFAGYEAIRPLVRRASAALADTALGHPPNGVVLGRLAELGGALELRDSAGALVPVDFIELTDWPGGAPEVPRSSNCVMRTHLCRRCHRTLGPIRTPRRRRPNSAPRLKPSAK